MFQKRHQCHCLFLVLKSFDIYQFAEDMFSHILLSEIHWADNHIKSAPHELRSLPMRHLYLSSPAAHPVFITQRNWWQTVHFSFGSVADSIFFIACFNSSFIFYHYTMWAFVVGGSKGRRVPPHPRHSSRWLTGCTEILMLIIIHYISTHPLPPPLIHALRLLPHVVLTAVSRCRSR